MKELSIVFGHELRSFVKSGKSSLFLLLSTALIWGGVIAGKVDTIESVGSYMWVLFFALVAGAGLSTTVFVRERLSSTLEILIMSGIERNAILYGKLLFTSIMTGLIGGSAFLLAFLIKLLIFREPFFQSSELILALILYFSTSILVSSSSSYFSMALSNPRLVQFFNFTLLTVLSIGYTLFAEFMFDSLIGFSAVILMIAVLFMLLSFRLFRSEKIIQPLIY